MAAKVGSLRHNFEERSKERLLTRRDCSELGLNSNGNRDDEPSDRVARLYNGVCELFSKLHEMGRSDPRKVLFAMKSGLSLALVSLFIYIKEEQLSKYSIWAILTVVVVFEFSVGITYEFFFIFFQKEQFDVVFFFLF